MNADWKDLAAYVVNLERQLLCVKDQRAELAMALKNVIAIADRKHDFFDASKAVLAKLEDQ